MIASVILLCLTATSLVAGHSKVSVVVGNLGGNGTALGVKGGIIPGDGDNTLVRDLSRSSLAETDQIQTEQDATVFLKNEIMSDDMGYTDLGGYNKLSQIAKGMMLSGNTLPQVSAAGGSISGTYHVITTDGAGPVAAVLDPTGTGKFSTGVPLAVATQVPGDKGYYIAMRRSLWTRALEFMGLEKRAKNVNLDFVSLPPSMVDGFAILTEL